MGGADAGVEADLAGRWPGGAIGAPLKAAPSMRDSSLVSRTVGPGSAGAVVAERSWSVGSDVAGFPDAGGRLLLRGDGLAGAALTGPVDPTGFT